MTDDLLRKATQALREESDAAEDSARFTRSRVMASVHKSELRRRTRLAFVLPIAASFAAATAWGTVNGKTGAWIAQISETLGFSATPATSPPAAPKPKPAPRGAAPAAPTPPVVPAPSEPPASEAGPASDTGPAGRSSEHALSAKGSDKAVGTSARLGDAARVSAQHERAGTSSAAKATSNAAPTVAATASGEATDSASVNTKLDVSDPAHDLYRAAHRRHFVEQNYGAALAAWDTYLREAPSGRFVLEARYNRALCLARLGRDAEARGALTPFAAGQYGGYRQREASALLDALTR